MAAAVGPVTFSAVWSDQGFQSALQKTIQQMQQFDQQLMKVGQDMKGLGGGGGAGLGQMAQQVQQVAQQQEKAVNSTQKFGAALKSNILSISTAGAGIVGLVQSFTGLEQAHAAVTRSDTMLEAAHQKVIKATDAYNKAVAQFGSNSHEAAVKLGDLQVAEDRLTSTTEKNTLAHDRWGEALGNFATTIAPQVITAGGGIAQIFTNVEGLGAKLTGSIRTLGGIFSTAFSGAASAVSSAIPGFTGLGTAVEGTTMKIRLMSIAMAAVPFAVGAAAAGVFIAAVNQIYTHTAAVHEFFNALGSDIQTVIPHAKQSFVDMGNAVTDTARFFQIGLDRISNSLHLTNINQDITKEKMSELLQQVETTGSTTIAKFDQETKAIVKSYADQGKSIDQAIADYKKNDDQLAISTAKTNSAALITSAAWQSMAKAIDTAFNNTKGALSTFVTNSTNEVQRLTGIIPSISKSFGAMGGTVVSSLSIIDDAFKNMKDESVVSIEGAASQIKLGLDKMKTAAVSAGGVIKDQFFNAWKDVNELLANPTHANLVKTAESINQLDIAIKNNEGALKASETGFISFGNQIVDMSTGKVVPAIASVGSGLDNLIPKINNVAAAAPKAFMDLASGEIKLGSASDTTAIKQSALGSIIEKGVPVTKTFGTGVQFVGGALEQLQVKALGLTNPLGSIIEYGKKGSTTMTTFGNGVKDAQTELDNLNHSISAGTEMRDALNLGFVKASLALVQLKVDTEQARGELIRMNQALADGTLVNENYAKGLVAGGLKFVDLVAKAAQAAGEQKTYNEALAQTTGAFFKLNPLLEQDTKSMELVARAMTGDAEAAKSLGAEMLKAFTPLAGAVDSLIGGVAGKLGDLTQNVKKPFADIPKYIADSMSIDLKQFVLTKAQFKKLGDDAIGVFGAALLRGGAQGGLDFLQNLDRTLQGSDLAGALQPAITDLQNAVANKGTPAGAMWVQKAVAELQKLGLSTPQIAQMLTTQFGNAGTPAGNAFVKNFIATWSTLKSQMAALTTSVAAPGQTPIQSRFAGLATPGPTPAATPAAGGAGIAAAATQTDALSKSMSLLNAVILNSQKDFSLLNSVLVNTGKDFSVVNAVILNSQKDLSLMNAVIINSQKDFSLLNGVVVNSQKDFSLVNSVLVNTGKDLSTANTAAGALTKGLSGLNAAAGSAAQKLSSMNSVIVNTGKDAGSAAGQVRSLASAINSLQSKSVTLTVIHRDVFQTVFAQHGLHSVLTQPTHIVAGESGPERVDITPLSQGHSRNTNVIHNSAAGGSNTGPIKLDSTTNIYLNDEKITTVRHSKLIDRYIGSVATAAG